MPGLLVDVAVSRRPDRARRREAGRHRGDEDGEHPVAGQDCVVAEVAAKKGESLAVDQVIILQ
jgi:hypothetical protein